MLEHAFIPLWVEHARACFNGDLLFQRTHSCVSFGLVANVDRRRFTAFGHLDGLGDSAQSVKVIVHRGHPQLNRVEVLISKLHIGQCGLHEGGLLHCTSCTTVGKTFAPLVRFSQFSLIVPAAALHQVVHISTVGTFGIAVDPQGCGF